MNIGVFGAGTWGTALARLLSLSGCEVTVWSKSEETIRMLAAERRHKNLPGCVIPDEIRFTHELREAAEGKELILTAVPSVYVRGVFADARPHIPDGQIIVDAAKGIEADTLFTMSSVIQDELTKDGQHDHIRVAALSGPTHAEEVAKDLPSVIVSACRELSVAETVQDVFNHGCLRVYTNTDLTGVELCGALKNIIALAAGISAGLGYGDNTKAALLTRGMAEIERLGLAMGCDPRTFSGLAGMGDLIVTATSRHSRNNRCGQLIGRGCLPAEAVQRVGMVVEGVNALPAAMKLAEKYRVDMPITRAVNDIVEGDLSASAAVEMLMSRRSGAESADSGK